MRTKLLICFLFIFTITFSNVKNNIIGEFTNGENNLKISTLDNSKNLFLIDYSIFEKENFLEDDEKKLGKIIFVGNLMEVYRKSRVGRKEISKYKQPDLRYTFNIEKIISSTGHENFYTLKKDKMIYINYFEIDKVLKLSFGSYSNPEFKKILK